MKIIYMFISFITSSHSSRGLEKYEKGKISLPWELKAKIIDRNHGFKSWVKIMGEMKSLIIDQIIVFDL